MNLANLLTPRCARARSARRLSLFICSLALLCLPFLPAPAQSPDASCGQDLPLASVSLSTNCQKFYFQEFTNADPPRVHMYLQKLTVTTTNGSTTVTNTTEGGQSEDYYDGDELDSQWGPGTASEQFGGSYNGTEHIKIDRTNELKTTTYTGSSSYHDDYQNSGWGSNWWAGANGCTSHSVRGPYNQNETDTGTLTDTAWVMDTLKFGYDSYYGFEASCPDTYFLFIDNYWTNNSSVTNGPSVDIVGSEVSRTQTELHYEFVPQPQNSSGESTVTLSDEYTDDDLKAATARALARLSLDDTNLVYRAGDRASYDLSQDELTLQLAKARYVFRYQTETNKSYIITHYFTVWTNHAVYFTADGAPITFTNFVEGDGTTRSETNDIIPSYDYSTGCVGVKWGTNFLFRSSSSNTTVGAGIPFPVMATTGMVEVALTRVTIQPYGGCPSCGPGGAPGDQAAAFTAGPCFVAPLGRTLSGAPCGELRMESSQASLPIYMPNALALLAVTSNVTPVYNLDGSLRQVGAPECLADISVIQPHTSYQVVFYSVNAFIPGHDGCTPIPTNNLPVIVTWTIENPDLTQSNRLRIIETRGSLRITNLYTAVGQGSWQFQAANGTRAENFIRTSDPANLVRWDTHQTVDPASGRVLAQTVSTYRILDSGEALVARSEGTGSAIRTNAYEYYNAGDGIAFCGMVKSTTADDGYTQNYNYDRLGRIIGSTSSAGHAGSRSILYFFPESGGYTGPPAGFTDDTNCWPLQPREMQETFDSTLVNGTFFVAATNVLIEIRYGDPEHTFWLCTTNRYYPSGDPNATKLKSIERPDGTIILYSYNLANPNSVTNTVLSGQPTSDHTGIVSGTKTVTVLGGVGQLLLEQTFDISPDHPAGILTSQNSYAYSDSLNRSYTVTHLDNTTEVRHYACCGLDYTIDRDGATTLYYYDALKRVVSTVQTAFNITTSNRLDAAGNTLATIRIAGSSAITNWSGTYDALGRLASETNALGGRTLYTYSYDGNGYPTKTATYPDGGTRTETYNPGGSLFQVTGTAVAPVRYYRTSWIMGGHGGASAECTKEVKLDAGGNETAETLVTFFDPLGRVVEINRPSGYTDTYYDTLGRRSQEVDPDGVTSLFQYNPRGDLEYTALHVDACPTISFAGNDRITRTVADVVADHSTNVLRTRTCIWPTSGADSPVWISTNEVSAEGLRSWSLTPAGLASIQTVYAPNGYRYVTNTAPDGSYTVAQYRYGRLLSTTRKDAGGNQLTGTTYAYDPHGRLQNQTDARNGTTTFTYNNADQPVSVTTPLPGGLAWSAQTTTTAYDTSLRAWKVTQPDGTSVTNEFFPTGKLKKTYGSRTYPVEYTYDNALRMQAMTTWQNIASAQGAAVTTWVYDQNGRCTAKYYPDRSTGEASSSGPSYYYTSAGRLLSRYSQQGTAVFYIYDNAGQLTNVSYGGITMPSIAKAYDRLGRLSQIQVQDSYTVSMTYDIAGNMLSQSFSGGTLDGITLTNSYDQLLRRTNLWAKQSNNSLLQQSLSYDTTSRIQSVSDGTDSATYSYLANSPLVSQILYTNSGVRRMTTTRQYDLLNRLTSINSAVGSSAIGYSYDYNAANQRTRRTESDGSYWRYTYDPLGQVTAGKKFWSDQTPVAGQQFEYGFDDIGNRTGTKVGGDENGGNLRPAAYAVNFLNQYTGRDVPGAVDVIGVALATTNVTVTAPDALNNSTPSYRKGEYFRKQLSFDNTTNALWEDLTVSATGQTNVSGNNYLPQTPESFTYDNEGNLVSDGRWTYTWDAENRLTSMTARQDISVGPQWRLDFEYDWQGRRITKDVSVLNTYTRQYDLVTRTKFVYDGWNLIAELDGSSQLLRSYVWGLDLSGSLQGAGGVGGLVVVRDQSTIGNGFSAHFAAFDGNGNLAALVNAVDGTVSAQYEYGPFGEAIRATGPMAKANSLRFSTKQQDDETDLVYYGRRYYTAGTGRWNARDPIFENGGINLYALARNRAVGEVDSDGLAEFPTVPTLPSFPWPHPLPPPIRPPHLPPSLPPLPSFIPHCLLNCAKYAVAGKDARDTFANLLQNYTCTCNGKQVSMADYDGCENGDPACSWQVAHRIWGCYAKKYGVPRLCMLMGNVAWEELEASVWGHEWTKHGGLGGYVRDTVADMAAVIEGYDSGASDCDHAFIPGGCSRKDGISN